MLKKVIGLISILLLINILGCGKKEKLESKVVLKWAGYGHVQWDKYRQQESQKFEELHPGVVVKYEGISGIGYTEKILTQAVGGTLYDVFFVPAGGFFNFVKNNLLLDLTPYIEKDKEYFDQLPSHFIEFMSYNDKLYGLPGNAGVHCVYYNKELFDREGVSYPKPDWTWEDFIEIAQRLTKYKEIGLTQFGVCMGVEPFVIFNSFGGKFWNGNKTKCVFDSQENIEALQFLRDLHSKHKVAPSPQYSTEMIKPFENFLSGRVGMYVGISSDRGVFTKKIFDWGVVPLPVKEGTERKELLRYLRLGVYSKTKHPELAVELLKFLVSPDWIKFLIQKGDSLPLREKGEEVEFFLTSYPQPREEKEMFLKILFNSNPESFYEYFGHPEIPIQKMDEIVTRYFELYDSLGRISAEECARKITDEIKKLF